MKESIKFILDNKSELEILKEIIGKNSNIEIINNKINNEISFRSNNEIVFRRNNMSLNQQIDIIQLLYVIIGGGGVAAIVKCITDVIEKYLECSKGKIKICKGNSTIEFDYKLSDKGELNINEELIRNIIISENENE